MSPPRLHQALAAHRAGDLDAARAGYCQVLETTPRDPDALHLLGVAHLQQGRPAEAAALIRRALALQPALPDAWAHLAAAMRTAGLPAEAAACWREVQRRDPGNAEARRALALLPAATPPTPAATLHQRAADAFAANQPERALTLYRQAALRLPDPAIALTNAASVLLAMARPEEALATLEAVPPDHHPAAATAWRHRGAALGMLDRPDQALAACRRCLALDPDNPDAQLGEATTLLLLGRYEEGWRRYENRWHLPSATQDGQASRAPLWLGDEDLQGETLLLRAEQGYGDILQFLRYVPLLRGRAGRLVLALPAGLLRLAAGLADAVVDQDHPLPPHHRQTPLMSLPLVMGTRLPTIPADIPYLHPDPALRAAWRHRLGPRPPGRLRVGVAWTGDPRTPMGWLRRVPPETLLPALAATGAEIHVLHKEIAPEDRAALAGLRTHDAELTDFAETAALLAEMDVVVSSCTSVAHLAGALGRPLLLMLQFAADFRWLRHREDSPWYPTARLFRQQRRGEWDTVIEGVVRELKAKKDQ